MKPALRNGLLIAGALALIAGIVLWWRANYVQVERTRHLPPRGEASYNPLYALKIALRNAGVRAESRQRLRLGEIALGAHDTVLILNDPRTLSRADTDGLFAWVTRGGHLLVRMPPAERSGEEIRSGQLLWTLKLRPLPEDRDCMRLAPPPGTKPAPPEAAADAAAAASHRAAKRGDEDDDWPLFCSSARFTMDGVEPRVAWGDLDHGYVYARVGYGEGTVDVLADFDFLTGQLLEQRPYSAFTRQLLQPNWKQGTVHLIYAASMPPLWQLLLDKAWMAWLPLALALLAWLWMRVQRFGPLRPTPESGRRALLEHVQATGEHLWRYGRAPMLHAAMRDRFLARLRRRDPLAAALDGDAQAAAIAERTGVPAADVAYALQSPRPNDAADFRLRIARLIQLRLKL